MVSKAGNQANSDCEVIVKGGKPKLVLNTKVEKIYGKAVEKTVKEMLKELYASKLNVEVNDRGALDFVLRARVEAAVRMHRRDR